MAALRDRTMQYHHVGTQPSAFFHVGCRITGQPVCFCPHGPKNSTGMSSRDVVSLWRQWKASLQPAAPSASPPPGLGGAPAAADEAVLVPVPVLYRQALHNEQQARATEVKRAAAACVRASERQLHQNAARAARAAASAGIPYNPPVADADAADTAAAAAAAAAANGQAAPPLPEEAAAAVAGDDAAATADGASDSAVATAQAAAGASCSPLEATLHASRYSVQCALDEVRRQAEQLEEEARQMSSSHQEQLDVLAARLAEEARAAAAQRKAEAAAAKQAAREAARAAQQQGRQRAGDKALAAGPQPAVGSNGFRRRLLTRSDIGSGLVGATLHIHWPDDDTWWKGYVEVVDEARCTAIIRYPETEEVEDAHLLDLIRDKQAYIMVPPPPAPPPKQQQQVAAAAAGGRRGRLLQADEDGGGWGDDDDDEAEALLGMMAGDGGGGWGHTALLPPPAKKMKRVSQLAGGSGFEEFEAGRREAPRQQQQQQHTLPAMAQPLGATDDADVARRFNFLSQLLGHGPSLVGSRVRVWCGGASGEAVWLTAVVVAVEAESLVVQYEHNGGQQAVFTLAGDPAAVPLLKHTRRAATAAGQGVHYDD